MVHEILAFLSVCKLFTSGTKNLTLKFNKKGKYFFLNPLYLAVETCETGFCKLNKSKISNSHVMRDRK